MTEKLKPCPFCGGKAEALGGVNTHWISCVDCITESAAYDTLEEAVKAWNRRTTDAQS